MAWVRCTSVFKVTSLPFNTFKEVLCSRPTQCNASFEKAGLDNKPLLAYSQISNDNILISALVIASTVILTVLGAIIWFLYKRNSDSGFTTVFSSAPQSPYNDDCVLVVAEENECNAQFD